MGYKKTYWLLSTGTWDMHNRGKKSSFVSVFTLIWVYSTVDFFHIPAAISLPHFYLGAERYQKAVIGMRPNKEEHQTIIDAEPVRTRIPSHKCTVALKGCIELCIKQTI